MLARLYRSVRFAVLLFAAGVSGARVQNQVASVAEWMATSLTLPVDGALSTSVATSYVLYSHRIGEFSDVFVPVLLYVFA